MRKMKLSIVALVLCLMTAVCTNAQIDAFRVSMGYSGYNLDFNGKAAHNSTLNFGLNYTLPFLKPMNIGLDYGFETPQKDGRAWSCGAELAYNFLGLLVNPSEGDDRCAVAFAAGARYQHDNIFTNNLTLKSDAVGPFARIIIMQQFRLEVGYLWGLNELDLSLDKKGMLNTFYARFGINIPLNDFRKSKPTK